MLYVDILHEKNFYTANYFAILLITFKFLLQYH